MTSPITISLDPTATYGEPISPLYFGANYIFDYERIGSLPWEKFDEVIDAVGATGLRYPGGVAAETVFDITNPDANTYVDAKGVVQKIMPLSHFLAYCSQVGANPTIIIPTKFALTGYKINGHQEFDKQWEDEIIEFIKFVIKNTDPALQISFEIGNEYWAYMTAVEYGRVASAITALIEQAIDEFSDENGLPQEWQHPEIFIQVQADSPNGSFSQEQLVTKNLNVLAEFNTLELAAVDGVVSHFYYSENNTSPNAITHSIDNIGLILQDIAQLHSMWSTAAGREIVSRMSEWNVHHQSVEGFGLQQIPVMLELLSEFVRNGFDVLDFWSAQYHPTSLAASNGNLMAAGIIFDYVVDLLAGAVGVDVTFDSDQVEVVAFQNGNQIVVFASSMTANPLQLSLEGTGFLEAYQFIGGTIIGVDETTGDGLYRNFEGLPIFGEPDVKFTTEVIVPNGNGPTTTAAELGSHETVILIFEILDKHVASGVVGTTGDDLLIANMEDFVFDGLSGNDIVSFERHLSGVTADLTNGSKIPSSVFQFTGIEGLMGSEFSDRLYGNDEGNLLVGAGGDDLLHGGAGNDTILGGHGNDTIVGSDGNDVLRGDGGDDLLIVGGGLDILDGGTGFDLADYSRLANGVTVDLADSSRNAGGALGDTLIGIEGVIGTDFADFLRGNSAGNLLVGGGGNDTLDGGAGADTLEGRGGNDLLLGGAGPDILLGGSGNDSIFGGSSTDQLFGGSGADTLDGGEESDIMFVDRFDIVTDTGTVGYDKAQINDPAGIALSLAGWSGVERVNGYIGNDLIDASTYGKSILLYGDAGADTLIGSQFNDTILGGDGDDSLVGGNGNDTLLGGRGNDSFDGGNGSDIFYIGESGDTVNDTGTTGYDRAIINNPSGIFLHVSGWSGVERIVGYVGNDTISAAGSTKALTITGGDGDDQLTGSEVGDTIYGGNGADTVFGGGGADALIGGNGNDRLDGGTGNDFLLGGAGADTFVFNASFGSDVIKDFSNGVDIIDFSGHAGVSSLSDLVIQTDGSNTLISLAAGGGDLITLVGIQPGDLDASDFIFL